MITKINVGLSLARNYQKITLEFIDEPVTHENEEQLKAGIQKRFKIINEEIEKEFGRIQK